MVFVYRHRPRPRTGGAFDGRFPAVTVPLPELGVVDPVRPVAQAGGWDPPVSFRGMATDTATRRGLEQYPVELVVYLFRDDPRVEVGPARNDRVERLDHRRLRGRPVAADSAGQLGIVTGLCVR